MNTNLAVKIVEEAFRQHAPHLVESGWVVVCFPFSRNKAAFCEYDKKRIILSSYFVEINEESKVLNWGKHEIAHALTPGHHHDKVWKNQAIQLGIEPRRCFVNGIDGIAPLGKYQATCPKCQEVFHIHQNPKNVERWCRKCGRVCGQLVFSKQTSVLV